MSLAGKHIISTKQFDNDLLGHLFDLADYLEPVARGLKTTRVLEGAVLANLFFEPSTRTRVSFDSAFMRLGGSVSHTTGFSFSSIAKGESLFDTSRVVSGYSDVIVIRHPTNGAVAEFAAATNVPVINGGCGSEEHPTQSLLDMYTLRRELKRLGRTLQGTTIAFVGDLKYGRTVHSLVTLLALTPGIHFVFASPRSLALPKEYLAMAAKSAASIREVTSLEELAKHPVDVIYGTRIQRERLTDEGSELSNEGGFKITRALCDTVNARCVMHPLPRDSRDQDFDLSTDLDEDERLAIFRQTDNGIQIRMALFAQVMGVETQVRAGLKDARWWRPDSIGPLDAPFYTPSRR